MPDKLKNSIESINLSQYEPTHKVEKPHRNGKWIDCGEENLYPDYIVGLFEKGNTHHTISVTMVQMILGDGIRSAIEGGDQKIKSLQFNDILESVILDFYLHGIGYIEIIRNAKDEPLELRHIPSEDSRLGYSDEKEEDVDGIWYSQDWSNYRKDKYAPEFIPNFNPSGKESRSVLVLKRTTPGSKWYPSPTYQGCIDYIEAEIRLAELHNNQLANGYFPSFIVSFKNGVPNLEERNEVQRSLDRRLSGTQNAGKAITLYSGGGSEDAPDITPMAPADQHSLYEYVGKLTTDQIMRGHRVTNPILFGVRDGGGLGNNANETVEAQRQMDESVIFPDRKLILKELSPLLSAVGVVPDWGMIDEDGETDTDLSYDQGQIAQVREILTDYNLGVITPSQARSLVSSLLAFDDKSAEEMFPDKVEMGEQKKKLELTDDWAKAIVDGLTPFSETIADLEDDGWSLILIENAGTHEDEKGITLDSVLEKAGANTELAGNPSIYAHPGERSKFGDKGLYKLRYRYSRSINQGKGRSRSFCVDMVGLSKRGYIFRKEDIDDMSGNSSINGQFAPQGQTTYDLFEWKGGAYCHHHWERLIFFRKRNENGQFLPPSPKGAKTERGMRNSKRVGNVPFVPQNGDEGIAPIKTESKGSIKNA